MGEGSGDGALRSHDLSNPNEVGDDADGGVSESSESLAPSTARRVSEVLRGAAWDRSMRIEGGAIVCRDGPASLGRGTVASESALVELAISAGAHTSQ
jgi:hypothetical protein